MLMAEKSFKNYMEQQAKYIEIFLDQTLFETKGSFFPKRLREAMRYGTLGNGKRIRPIITLEVAKLLSGNAAYALRAGSALELVHCYSLIHDDLPSMDDDDLRRGRPTVHKAFDEATAILAGDALLTLAFEILSEEETHPDPQIRINCVRILAQASGACGMVGGQLLDLAAEGRFGGSSPDINGIKQLQSMKTGALLTAAVELGSLISNASLEQSTQLRKFGQNIGAAFQIADDILDREATTERLGKRVGKDREKGKGTLVDLLGLETAREECQRLQQEAFALIEPFGEQAEMLKNIFIYTVTRKK